MAENHTTQDWQSAPKDGSVINAKFPDGTHAKVRWDAKDENGRWTVRRSNGRWLGMDYDHGQNEPIIWWPSTD